MKIIFSLIVFIVLSQRAYSIELENDPDVEQEIIKNLDVLMEFEVLEDDQIWDELLEKRREEKNESI